MNEIYESPDVPVDGNLRILLERQAVRDIRDISEQCYQRFVRYNQFVTVLVLRPRVE